MPSKPSTALAKLVPNAIKVSVEGEEVFVASNREENSMLNMVVAARMRNILENTLKSYKEKGVIMSPKELREFTEAAKNIAELSDAIYAGADPLTDNSSKQESEKKVDPIDIDFDKMTNANKNMPPNQPPNP